MQNFCVILIDLAQYVECLKKFSWNPFMELIQILFSIPGYYHRSSNSNNDHRRGSKSESCCVSCSCAYMRRSVKMRREFCKYLRHVCVCWYKLLLRQFESHTHRTVEKYSQSRLNAKKLSSLGIIIARFHFHSIAI